MRWSEERDPSTNHLLYQLANFTTKEESEADGFTVTHDFITYSYCDITR